MLTRDAKSLSHLTACCSLEKIICVLPDFLKGSDEGDPPGFVIEHADYRPNCFDANIKASDIIEVATF